MAVEEGIDGLDAVDGCIPSLRTLLMEQPLLHLANGLRVVRRESLEGFDGGHLRRDAIVAP